MRSLVGKKCCVFLVVLCISLLLCSSLFGQEGLSTIRGTATDTNGLSNVSNGSPEHLRPILNQTFLMLLINCGVQGAIVDAFDKPLQDIARGKMPELVDLVGKVMNGEQIDVSKLSKEETDYVKTAKVLLGKSLYSDSWLDL